MKQILYKHNAIDMRKIEKTGRFETHIVGTQNRFTGVSDRSTMRRAKQSINKTEEEKENEIEKRQERNSDR